jgi:Protein N-terminal asparagine amidohydrolase
MVITSSDSTNTLVGLDEHESRKQSITSVSVSSLPQEWEVASKVEFRRTALFLPVDELGDFDGDYSSDDEDSNDDDSSCYPASVASQSHAAASSSSPCVLYLPEPQSSVTVDECLARVPAFWDARDDLLSQTTHIALDGKRSPDRILYVAQGELAHCVPSHTDVLVSDRATTCHVLALRSTSTSSVPPLCTMAHIDGTDYSSCMRSVMEAHQMHHHQDPSTKSLVELDIHMVGGFNDAHGSSRDITSWLLRELATLADEYADSIRCTLRTVCVSSLNHNGSSDSPFVRGLAMQCCTGRVFSAQCDAVGPAAALRASRLWSPAHSAHQRRLYVIHTAQSDHIVLEPFSYQVNSAVMSLLEWSDEELLQSCSTSPHCEDDDFCQALRRTLRFMSTTPYQRVFADLEPLTFRRRTNNPNQWVRC